MSLRSSTSLGNGAVRQHDVGAQVSAPGDVSRSTPAPLQLRHGTNTTFCKNSSVHEHIGGVQVRG